MSLHVLHKNILQHQYTANFTTNTLTCHIHLLWMINTKYTVVYRNIIRMAKYTKIHNYNKFASLNFFRSFSWMSFSCCILSNLRNFPLLISTTLSHSGSNSISSWTCFSDSAKRNKHKYWNMQTDFAIQCIPHYTMTHIHKLMQIAD